MQSRDAEGWFQGRGIEREEGHCSVTFNLDSIDLSRKGGGRL